MRLVRIASGREHEESRPMCRYLMDAPWVYAASIKNRASIGNGKKAKPPWNLLMHSSGEDAWVGNRESGMRPARSNIECFRIGQETRQEGLRDISEHGKISGLRYYGPTQLLLEFQPRPVAEMTQIDRRIEGKMVWASKIPDQRNERRRGQGGEARGRERGGRIAGWVGESSSSSRSQYEEQPGARRMIDLSCDEL